MARRVAIIGGGVAGISAAYALKGEAEITIFEAEDYLGGHANTIEVEGPGGSVLGLDTGFIIYNDSSYPEFSSFLCDLGVSSEAHRGGFLFFDSDTQVRFGTTEMDLPLEALRERYPSEFVAICEQARRFHKEAPADFLRRRADMSLGEYLSQNGYTSEFAHGYVVQLATAVWSMPPAILWQMPAATFIAFFMAHDAEGLGGRTVAWQTVAGGSIQYVRKALDTLKPNLMLSSRVDSIREDSNSVIVTVDGVEQIFDACVLAVHADDALKLLANPTSAQQRISTIQYNSAECVLHSDSSVVHGVSPDRLGSWNFGAGTFNGERRTWPVYYLNRLQGYDVEQDYYVTIDYPGTISSDAVIRTLHYRHPILTVAVRELQKTIYDVHEDTRIMLAGSYMHSKRLGPDQIGSHEAGFASGAEAGRRVIGLFSE